MFDLVKVFSFIFLLVVCPVILADLYFATGFLDKFLLDQSLSLMGTILAIYIAAAASFLSILIGYELQNTKALFHKTIEELKHNICFMTIVFFIHFLLLVMSQPATAVTPRHLVTLNDIDIGNELFKALKVLTFSLYIYGLYELNLSLFGIREKLADAQSSKSKNPPLSQ